MAFVLASILTSGWRGGAFLDLSQPYIYKGDFLFHSWLAQRAIEGWIFENARSGFPFGSTLYDFPNSDTGSLLIQKGLGLLSGSYYAALDLYYLLSFFVTFVITYCVLRSMHLAIVSALAAAALYTFLPFHQIRLPHLFYTWYFVVPIYFFTGYVIAYCGQAESQFKKPRLGILSSFIGFAFLASFGVYYNAFGLIVIAMAFVFSLIRTGNFKKFKVFAFVTSAILFGTLANLTPTLIYSNAAGGNPEVAARTPADSETFGLKLIQMFNPRASHRLAPLRSLAKRYGDIMPLTNENTSAALGVVGSVGLLLLAVAGVGAMAGRTPPEPMAFLALCTLTLFLFGTIGGLGDIFANVVSPLLRAWNRISVFIAFPAIVAVFLALQRALLGRGTTNRRAMALAASVLAITVAGIFDQTIGPCSRCGRDVKATFETDRDFIGTIEAALPKGSAVYQLPYMPFPESPYFARLESYQLASGFFNSSSLRWSFGGMKGRAGDLFYRTLALEPLSRQLELARKLGFRGIYIDRRGYADNGEAVVKTVAELIGTGPRLVRSDGEVVFFEIQPTENTDLSALTASEIMKKVGYEADRLGHRVPGTPAEGIEFTTPDVPYFIRDIQGLSTRDGSGRWSDALLSPTVRIAFASPLPRRFTLIFTLRPFMPNIGQESLVRIGSQQMSFRLKDGENEVAIPFDLQDESVDTIEFIPHDTAVPLELGVNADRRKVGLQFIRLRFVE